LDERIKLFDLVVICSLLFAKFITYNRSSANLPPNNQYTLEQPKPKR